jgi:hypothetical protein
MSKNVVVLLKDYKPNVVELRQPPVRVRRWTVNAVVKPLADELWEKSEPFRDLLTSIDASTSPNQWVAADKIDAARFVVEYAKKNSRAMPDFLLSAIHKALLEWASENKVTRKAIKAAAKTMALQGLKAAE